MYEYNITDIISEEDDLPSLQIHAKQFLDASLIPQKSILCPPVSPKWLIMWGFSVNISITKHEAIISTPQFLA